MIVSVVSGDPILTKKYIYIHKYIPKSNSSKISAQYSEWADIYVSTRSDSQMFMWLEAEKH